MSNPIKVIKKNIKPILTVVAVAAVGYAALPAIAALGGAAAAGGGAAAAAGTVGATAASGAAAGAGAAATGAGLLAKGAVAAKAVGSTIAGASPLVKMGLIQAGTQFAAGALAEEPQTAAEAQAEQLAVLHNQPTEIRNFGSSGQSVGLIQPQSQAPTSHLQTDQLQTTTVPEISERPAVSRYNPETKRWGRA